VADSLREAAAYCLSLVEQTATHDMLQDRGVGARGVHRSGGPDGADRSAGGRKPP
jgi:hypothetical protein